MNDNLIDLNEIKPDTLHINQRSLLMDELLALFPKLPTDKLWDSLKDLTYQKYRYLLALCYQKEKNRLDVELYKLGLYN